MMLGVGRFGRGHKSKYSLMGARTYKKGCVVHQSGPCDVPPEPSVLGVCCGYGLSAMHNTLGGFLLLQAPLPRVLASAKVLVSALEG
jgi:hypothetical protein